MDGTIYVGSNDNNLYAINPNGTQKWAFPTGGSVFSNPAIGSDGTIYVGSRDNNLYAVNPDGTQKWAFPTWSDVTSSPAIGSDGTIYIGSDDSNLRAINPNGTQKWAFPTGGHVNSSPAVGSDGTIYVGSDNGSLYAINGSSGGLANTPWPMFHHDLKHTGRAIPSSGPCMGVTAASTFGSSTPYGPLSLAKHLACLLIPMGAVLVLRIWRRKR